jgi:hypothetical protein
MVATCSQAVATVHRPARIGDLVREPVTFRWTYRFAVDEQGLTSDATLRFRERKEVERDWSRMDTLVKDVRAVPDRPGREFVSWRAVRDVRRSMPLNPSMAHAQGSMT